MQFSERILSRLIEAETSEHNPHFRDDIRIAWIIVLSASRGDPHPVPYAWYRVVGCHPDQVWPRIVARRRAILGNLYAQFFAECSGVNLPPKDSPGVYQRVLRPPAERGQCCQALPPVSLPPKKPVRSEKVLPLRRAA